MVVFFAKNTWLCPVFEFAFSCGVESIIYFESTMIPENSFFWQGWTTDFFTLSENLDFAAEKLMCLLQTLYPSGSPLSVRCHPETELVEYSGSLTKILEASLAL